MDMEALAQRWVKDRLAALPSAAKHLVSRPMPDPLRAYEEAKRLYERGPTAEWTHVAIYAAVRSTRHALRYGHIEGESFEDDAARRFFLRTYTIISSRVERFGAARELVGTLERLLAERKRAAECNNAHQSPGNVVGAPSPMAPPVRPDSSMKELATQREKLRSAARGSEKKSLTADTAPDAQSFSGFTLEI